MLFSGNYFWKTIVSGKRTRTYVNTPEQSTISNVNHFIGIFCCLGWHWIPLILVLKPNDTINRDGGFFFFFFIIKTILSPISFSTTQNYPHALHLLSLFKSLNIPFNIQNIFSARQQYIFIYYIPHKGYINGFKAKGSKRNFSRFSEKQNNIVFLIFCYNKLQYGDN